MNNTEKRLYKAGFGGHIGYSIKVLNTSNIVVVVKGGERCDWSNV